MNLPLPQHCSQHSATALLTAQIPSHREHLIYTYHPQVTSIPSTNNRTWRLATAINHFHWRWCTHQSLFCVEHSYSLNNKICYNSRNRYATYWQRPKITQAAVRSTASIFQGFRSHPLRQQGLGSHFKWTVCLCLESDLYIVRSVLHEQEPRAYMARVFRETDSGRLGGLESAVSVTIGVRGWAPTAGTFATFTAKLGIIPQRWESMILINNIINEMQKLRDGYSWRVDTAELWFKNEESLPFQSHDRYRTITSWSTQ